MSQELELHTWQVVSPSIVKPVRYADSIDAALDFAEEAVREARGSRRRAWIAFAVLVVICGAQAAALALLLPLRDIEPYTILVDRQTGYLETARGVRVGDLAEDEAVVHSFLAQYVLQRETFDSADFDERYRRVAAWSAEGAREDYLALYRPETADSILPQLGPGVVISTTVENIELLSPTTARVRFSLARRDPGLDPAHSTWTALVVFRFTGTPLRMQDRLVNPLGFQVTHYRRDNIWTSVELGAPVGRVPLQAIADTPAAPILEEGGDPAR